MFKAAFTNEIRKRDKTFRRDLKVLHLTVTRKIVCKTSKTFDIVFNLLLDIILHKFIDKILELRHV